MAAMKRFLLLTIACLTFLAAVPRAHAQVIVVGPHRRHYHHRYYRHPYHRHFHHRYHRY